MAVEDNKSDKNFRLRASLPRIFRYAAMAFLAVTILVVVAGFYRARSKSTFKLKSEHTQLSTDVTAEINGYERLETDGGLLKYYIKADYAKTFSDNHQELENAYIEVFDDAGNPADKMTAQKVLYVPAENKNFTAYMNGDVNIETRDALKIKTNNITYNRANETADADELIEFERENVRGKSFGATVKMGEKRVDLLKDVEIETFESPELVKSNVRYAKINANSASFDQTANKIELNENVAIKIESKSKSTGNPIKTDISSNRASVIFFRDPSQPKPQTGTPSAQLKKFELFENVKIVSTENGASPTNIDAGYALYDKDADRFELKNGTHIVAAEKDKPTDIRASEAIYEQSALKLALTGNVEITQGSDYLKGDTVNADLFADRKVKSAVVRGNAYARKVTDVQTATISAPELNADFNDARQLLNANAIGQSVAEIVPSDGKKYSLVTFSAQRGVGVLFKGEGLIDKLRTDGRTTIKLNAANYGSKAANKTVTADAVTTAFYDDGKNIRKAEAVGNAEVVVQPLSASAQNYVTTIDAPRFDCDFYPTGNNAKTCVGGKKTKTVRVPTVPSDKRGTQTLLADQLNTEFNAETQDVDKMDASGNAKFTELDRNAIASQFTYTAVDEMLRLRGGEPTFWDSQGRSKAREIDLEKKTNRSYLRGGVSTTYYSRKHIKNSAPFASQDKPVFVTSDAAEFDQEAETATFTGNARGWQANNYVRADRLFIKQADGKFLADGNVQSAVYNAKQKQKGKESTVPVYASAKSMTFDRNTHLIQYRENVDIRQGTDRLTSGAADVYLDENNELSKTVAENGVVITQPGRRASGNWVQYSSSDEVAVLRGDPASVNDSVNGSSQAGELTFMMRENRVISEGKSKQNTSGRIRTVYKVDPKKP